MNILLSLLLTSFACHTYASEKSEISSPQIRPFIKKHVFHNTERERDIEKLAAPTHAPSLFPHFRLGIASLNSNGTVDIWKSPSDDTLQSNNPYLTFSTGSKSKPSAITMRNDSVFVGDREPVIYTFSFEDMSMRTFCKLKCNDNWTRRVRQIVCDKNITYATYNEDKIAVIDKDGTIIERIDDIFYDNYGDDACKIMVDDNYLYAYGALGTVAYWDQRTWQKVGQSVQKNCKIPGVNPKCYSLESITGTPAFYYAYTNKNDIVQQKEMKLKAIKTGRYKVAAITLAKDELFIGNKEGSIAVHNAQTTDYICKLTNPFDDEAAITDLAYNPETKDLYASYANGTIINWSRSKKD